MTMINENILISDKIEVCTDKVIITNLQINGTPAQRIIEGCLNSIDPSRTLKQMLEFGAIALGSIQTDSLVQHLEAAANSFTKAVQHEANVNFPQIIGEKTEEFVASLTSYLDPTQVNSLRNQMDIGLTKIREEITAKVIEGLKENKTSMQEGLTNLGYMKKVFDKSTTKGIPHQDYVGRTIESFAGADLVSDLSTDSNGHLYASGRGKSGDFLVTLSETVEQVKPSSFVVEAKDSKLSEKEALLEIDTNKKNRGVDVGILVFASIEQAPTQGKVIKFFPGNRIITVCDHESETALYAAYAFARQMVKMSRAIGKTDENFIFRSIQEIVGHLEIETTINKEAKAIGAALERLVSSALTARSKVLDTLGKINS